MICGPVGPPSADPSAMQIQRRIFLIWAAAVALFFTGLGLSLAARDWARFRTDVVKPRRLVLYSIRGNESPADVARVTHGGRLILVLGPGAAAPPAWNGAGIETVRLSASAASDGPALEQAVRLIVSTRRGPAVVCRIADDTAALAVLAAYRAMHDGWTAGDATAELHVRAGRAPVPDAYFARVRDLLEGYACRPVAGTGLLPAIKPASEEKDE